MKNIFNKITIGFCLLFCNSSLPQFADLRFEEIANNGINYFVKTELKGTPQFKLGTSNITFYFNKDALSSPILDSAYNYSGGMYNNITVTNPIPGVCSINIELFVPGNGQSVDTTWKDIVSVRFDITNLAAYSGLSFRTNPPNMTNIWADDNATIIQQGSYDSLNTILPVEFEKPVVNSFNLFNNYPNPFNPSTVIKYSIGNAQYVTLKVYDILGNLVSLLVNGTKEAGTHEVVFNAGDLSSGIYIYKMESGNFSSTKKLLLMK